MQKPRKSEIHIYLRKNHTYCIEIPTEDLCYSITTSWMLEEAVRRRRRLIPQMLYNVAAETGNILSLELRQSGSRFWQQIRGSYCDKWPRKRTITANSNRPTTAKTGDTYRPTPQPSQELWQIGAKLQRHVVKSGVFLTSSFFDHGELQKSVPTQWRRRLASAFWKWKCSCFGHFCC